MRILAKALLVALWLTFALLPGDSQEQQTAPKPVYSLHMLYVEDTKAEGPIWLIEGGPFHDYRAYKSLTSPALLAWVSQSSKGTEIDYMPSSLPKINGLRDPEDGIPAFQRYCESKGVNFNDRFPVL